MDDEKAIKHAQLLKIAQTFLVSLFEDDFITLMILLKKVKAEFELSFNTQNEDALKYAKEKQKKVYCLKMSPIDTHQMNPKVQYELEALLGVKTLLNAQPSENDNFLKVLRALKQVAPILKEENVSQEKQVEVFSMMAQAFKPLQDKSEIASYITHDTDNIKTLPPSVETPEELEEFYSFAREVYYFLDQIKKLITVDLTVSPFKDKLSEAEIGKLINDSNSSG